MVWTNLQITSVFFTDPICPNIDYISSGVLVMISEKIRYMMIPFIAHCDS